MSNPEPPPTEQTAAPQTPAEAAPPPPEEAAAPETSAAETTSTEESAPQEEGAEHAAEATNGETEGQGAAPAGEKKRRRRRRKKKGAHADANAPGAEGGEAQEAKDGEGAAAEAADPNAAPKIEKRKREKKPGPPRERPPVNLGDIVFGKIVEITDEAIFVDIPGKAKAIFDRRELLLPDDDEAPPPPSPAVEAVTAMPTETAAAPGAAEATEEPAAASETATETGTEAAAATEAATEAAPAVEAEAAPEPAPEEAPAEPPKEPKLPKVTLEVGAEFIAVVHNDGGRGGLVVLTHHPRRAERTKPLLETAFNEKTLVDGLVTGAIKGGIEVDVDGVRAFAPGSHVDLHLGSDLHYLIGQRLPFSITQYAKRGRDVVLSRRAMIEEEAKKARAEALERLKVGEELTGVVRSVVPFGAFVDVGGVEGLVPLQEMSHNRSDGPSDVFKAGETTRVKVTKIDDKGKIWLSHKATIPDPWQQVAQKYAVHTKHTGKVVRLQPFGAFVELEPGIDGLIHLADLSLKRIDGPEDVVKVGDTIEVVVAHVDQGSHKIGLHPALQGDAANEAPQRVVPHKPVKCKVHIIESGGLIVRIMGVTGRHGRGYIPAGGTGTPRGTELRKVFSIGQEVEAKVMEIDPRRGEVKLSIKALSDDQERSAYQQYRQQVKAEARFTFADLLAKSQKK